MTKPQHWLLLFALLLGSLSAAPRARARPAHSSGPDVLILVWAMPSGQDEIGITYAGLIPHAQARRDAATLQDAAGWVLKRIHITDAPSSLSWDKAKMTGIECIATHVVRPATHGLSVQPFVEAFQAYPHVQLTYVVGNGFPFQGLHDYADNDVRIKLDPPGRGTFTYNIYIRHPHLGRLNLPYLQPATTDAQALPSRPKPWLLALAAVAAVGAGGAAYARLNRAG